MPFPLGAAVTAQELELDPHPALARLRAAEPVSWLPALDGWLITRRDLALAVMRDPEHFTVDDPRFTTGRVVGPSMLTLDGDEHRRHREPFAAPFRRAAVRERFAGFVAARPIACSTSWSPRGTASCGAAWRARSPRPSPCTRSGSTRPTPARSWGGTTRSSRP